jgi:hypothetical protein
MVLIGGGRFDSSNGQPARDDAKLPRSEMDPSNHIRKFYKLVDVLLE